MAIVSPRPNITFTLFDQRASVLDGKEVPPEKQRPLLALIAEMLAISVEDIALLEIVVGSITMTIQLPLDAAGWLLALYRLGDSQVARTGVLDVQLLEATDEPARQAVEYLAADEQARLQAADPSSDRDARLLLEALKLDISPQRREKLQEQLYVWLTERQRASLAIPEIAVPTGSATLRVTLSDSARQAA